MGLSLFKYTRDNQIIVLDGDLNKLKNIAEYADDPHVLISTSLKSGGTDDQTDLIDDFGRYNPDPQSSDRWWTQGDRRLLNELKVDKWVSWNQPVEGGPVYTTKGYRFYLRQYALKKGTFGWNSYKTVYELKNALIRVGDLPSVYPLYANGGTSPEVKPDYKWELYMYETNITYSYINTDFLRPTFSMQGDVSCRGFDGDLTFIQHKEHSVFP